MPKRTSKSKAQKDSRKSTEEKEQHWTIEDVNLGEALGVPDYEVTKRDLQPRAALRAKRSHPKCNTAEFDEALDLFLKSRYPWMTVTTMDTIEECDLYVTIREMIREVYRDVIEKDFQKLFDVENRSTLSDYPEELGRHKDILKGNFRYIVLNVIGCMDMVWDSLRIIPGLADKLNPHTQIIEKLCSFRDLISGTKLPPILALEERVVRMSVDESINVHLPGMARSVFFMFQFIVHTFLVDDSPSTAGQSTDSLKKARKSADSPKTAGQTADSPKTARQSADSAKAARQSADSPKAARQSADSPKTARQSADSPKTARQSADSPKTARQSADSPKTARQTADSPKTAGQSADSLKTARQSADSPKTARQSADSPKTARQSADSPKTARQSSDSLKTARQSADSPKTARQSADSPKTARQSADSPETALETGIVRDWGIASEAVGELFYLLGSAANTPSMLEEKVCDKLCDMFKLETRHDAKKHDWFKFFTFSDWKWIFGKERSFLDSVSGGGAACSNSATSWRLDSCRCDVSRMHKPCVDELKCLIMLTQKFLRRLEATVKALKDYWTVTVMSYTSNPDTSSNAVWSTLADIAKEHTSRIGLDLNIATIQCFVAIELHRYHFVFLTFNSPDAMLQLQYMRYIAFMRYYTNEIRFNSPYVKPSEENVQKLFSDTCTDITRKIWEFDLCLTKFTRNLSRITSDN